MEEEGVVAAPVEEGVVAATVEEEGGHGVGEREEGRQREMCCRR